MLGMVVLPALLNPAVLDGTFLSKHWLPQAKAQTVQLLNSKGWLEVQRLQGRVMIQTSAARQAKLGDRLTKPGDVVTTGPGASTVLKVDNRIGTVQVAQNSELRIRQLGVLRNGGWITTLNLDRGQARLKVDKRIMPRNSIFEVHSPSGVAGVRGTNFGVMLNPQNRLVVGTEEGLVEASAEGETVALKANFGSALFPGEPPLPPLELDRKLELNLVEVEFRQGQLWLSGNIYPLNTVFASDQELAVDKNGAFGQLIPIPSGDRLPLKVTNSVGEEQGYLIVGLDRDKL